MLTKNNRQAEKIMNKFSATTKKHKRGTINMHPKKHNNEHYKTNLHQKKIFKNDKHY